MPTLHPVDDPMTPVTIKPVPLGLPLAAMTEAELDALELPPSQEVIDEAVADWVRYAPARAKGYISAKIETPTDNTPRCPVCGMVMYQTRRGATLAKRGPAYLCPKDEAETWTDETGRRHRLSESQHKPARRVWELAELEAIP